MLRIRLALALSALLVAPLVAASDDTASDSESADPAAAPAGLEPGHEGYGLYQSLCADCHGVGAVGDGPRAKHLQPPPADLTRIEGLDGGPPRLEPLTRIIDGRRTIRAHERDGMPVWGDRLVAGEPDLVRRERARIRLVQTLAEYLLAIQNNE